MPNLVKLFTIHGPLLVDSDQLASGRTQLSIYTKTGKRLIDTKRGEAMHKNGQGTTVHKDNLFASMILAEENYQRIMTEIRSASCK